MTAGSALRVVVTGAGGRLGRTVGAMLSGLPEFDTVLFASPRSPRVGDRSRAIDLVDSDHLRAALDAVEPQVIVHLAGLAGAACETDPSSARAVNTGVAGVLRDWAEGAGVGRIVFASTAAVYGDQGDAPLTELAPTVGASVYALTKRDGERELAASTAVESVSLRIFNIFGPGFDDSLVARLRRSTEEEPVPVRGPNNFVRDYVHAIDVARAVISAIGSALPERHAVINVGSGVALTNEELIARLSAHGPVFSTPVAGARSYSVAEVSLARRVLGFAAEVLP